MKTIIATLTALSCIFINTVEGLPQTNQPSRQLTQLDHQALYSQCCRISRNVYSRYHNPGYKGSPYRSWQTVAQQEISDYLRSVGTAPARLLLAKLEANNFKGVA